MIEFERFVQDLCGVFGKKFGLNDQPDAKTLAELLNAINEILPIQEASWEENGSWAFEVILTFNADRFEISKEKLGTLLHLFCELHAKAIEYKGSRLEIWWL